MVTDGSIVEGGEGVSHFRSRMRVVLVAVAVLWPTAATPGRVLLTQEEALRLAFGAEAQVERRTAFLDESQMKEAGCLAGEGSPITSAMVPHYIARRGADEIGVAYFDTHRVRTEAETVMVVIGPAGQVLRVEVIAFHEPPDYLARAAWLRQFDERRLDDELALRRAIRPMTGATLTARAVTAAVRRVLALHAVIRPLAGGEEKQQEMEEP